ncbi:hypothetical protein SBA3_2500002 [Candidatus Sulfopaludibacter sp. SbA3]|nr:hypothetical protein SBA3_2500002 [Candidatus Sulfopaludibacter sp. SbA3]
MGHPRRWRFHRAAGSHIVEPDLHQGYPGLHQLPHSGPQAVVRLSDLALPGGEPEVSPEDAVAGTLPQCAQRLRRAPSAAGGFHRRAPGGCQRQPCQLRRPGHQVVGDANFWFGLDAIRLAECAHRYQRIDINGSGFLLPHRWTVYDTDASVNFRVGHFELQGGAKAFHYKSSPADEFFIRNTMASVFFGVRWYSQ